MTILLEQVSVLTRDSVDSHLFYLFLLIEIFLLWGDPKATLLQHSLPMICFRRSNPNLSGSNQRMSDRICQGPWYSNSNSTTITIEPKGQRVTCRYNQAESTRSHGHGLSTPSSIVIAAWWSSPRSKMAGSSRSLQRDNSNVTFPPLLLPLASCLTIELQ